MSILRNKLGNWVSPIVYLSSNAVSLTGVVLVTTAGVFWVFLLPAMLRGDVDNPYNGILMFLALPAAFFAGLALIPVGALWRARREHRAGSYPAVLPPLDLNNVRLKRLLMFIGATTLVNVMIAGQISYRALHYMDSVTFCGQTCHTVMQPEYAGYQESPHSRVACVQCHIGPGASWFVKSKMSGVGQVIAVTFGTYSRPIPTPVHNLRPARETCEQCHWPQKFGEDRLRVLSTYADDEANTLSRTVLLMRIGGGRNPRGIHGVHMRAGVAIRYAHADEKRQTIPWVEYNDGQGRVTTYLAPDTKPEAVKAMPVRVMDCVDCHNRPTHAFDLPERALDRAMASGDVSPALAFVKKTGLELLKKNYASQEEAERSIGAALENFYRRRDAAAFERQKADVARAARAITAIYKRNVFPAMKVTWGLYPNNIGHMDAPGCSRCHDDLHASADGRKITQDCNACHQDVAPEIAATMGLTR